jgi:hypothetical protein
MGASFGRTGRTSLELFKQDPENLKITLKPLRSEEANRDLLISFQVRGSHYGSHTGSHYGSHNGSH